MRAVIFFLWKDRERIPRCGASKRPGITKKDNATTMAGPVGILGIRELAVVPIAEDSAPMTADRRIIGSRRLVHCLAATAGAMSMALMRIMPTAWMERRTVIVARKERNTFSLPRGNPRTAA